MSQKAEKYIGFFFGVVAAVNVVSLFMAVIAGSVALATMHLLIGGYFAFRCKQLLSE
jgi:uncharacterized membrane protein